MSIQRCPACRARPPKHPADPCPRCGADRRAWLAWCATPWPGQARRFFLGNPWGLLALLALLLPPLLWAATDLRPPWLQTLILGLAFLLSLAGLGLIFTYRHRLWEYELLSQVVSGGPDRLLLYPLRVSLLIPAGLGLLVGVVVDSTFLLALLPATAQRLPLTFESPARWEILLLAGLALIGQTWAAGLYALYAHGLWLGRTVPQPIFTDRTRLQALADAEGRLRLRVRRPTPRSVYLLNVRPTNEAGLRMIWQVETRTYRSLEGYYLNAIRFWVGQTDRWGRVRHLQPHGPPDYITDPARPVDPPQPQPALEGEVIFPPQSLPSLDEAVLIALTTLARGKPDSETGGET